MLVDLDLQAGENTLLVRLTPGGEPSFYFSPSPDPVPRFWEQLRRDFPAAQNPLLDLVHADWFDTQRLVRGPGQPARRATARPAGRRLRRRRGVDPGGVEPAQAGQGRPGRPPLARPVREGVGARHAPPRPGPAPRRGRASWADRTPASYPAGELLARLDDYERRLTAQAGVRLDPADEATRRLMAEMPRMRRQMLVDLNPLLRGAEILFVKRYTYNSKHYYDDFQHISAWGGNLCVLSLADGRVRELVPQLAGGVFDRYDLSFDARRIVFGYRRPQPEGFRLYEVGVDGSGLRQVTQPPADEDRRIATYGRTSYRRRLLRLCWATSSGPTTSTPATCPTAASVSPRRGPSTACCVRRRTTWPAPTCSAWTPTAAACGRFPTAR